MIKNKKKIKSRHMVMRSGKINKKIKTKKKEKK